MKRTIIIQFDIMHTINLLTPNVMSGNSSHKYNKQIERLLNRILR
ncbi:hypothetical protein M096_2650 [Parabacteroides distasonis str. 3999B T(B) 6]|nr:hypothetical protein M095_2362 [Parabacteroides distasonis str. 3999B T(B) 4]KDS74545.1 hypothetical protein M096_2650 [Parabacteroides distasonis str. 3999B T(B) 6]